MKRRSHLQSKKSLAGVRFGTMTALGLLVVVAVTLSACAPQGPEPADLVILGGKIVTVDPDNPQAEALAARGQEIVAVGSDDEVMPFVGENTEVIRLDGALAVPGLIEGHAHFLSLGRSLMQLDLKTAASWDEVVAMVATAAAEAEPGQWILGRGWHQEKWTSTPEPSVEGLPFHHDLSRVSPDNPVRLGHASGHAALVNAKAMELAGVTAATPDPPGGEIVRDSSGRPIGVFRETAEELFSGLAGGTTEVGLRRQVEMATAESLSKGITSFQDAGVSMAEVDLLRAMAEAGELDLRLWMMLGESNEALAANLDAYRLTGVGGGYLTIGGIKRYMDGALGSHGAWLLEPYTDLPRSTGLNVEELDVLAETARLAAAHGYQLCVHAIGDRANRETLDLFEAAYEEAGSGDLRWRVEHAQHLHPDDVPRFADLGVIAAMQPTHCVSDGPWVPSRLGAERSEQGAYVWRTLLDSGAVISTGTDAPVEDVDPLATFYAAVTRRMSNGEDFFPAQRMSRMEALEAATIKAAYSAFEEGSKGSLEVGKLADVTVLSKDILSVPDEEILSTRILYTIVGGRVRFQAGE